MSLDDNSRISPQDPSRARASDIPVEQLLDEIYQSAPAAVRSNLLSQLVAKVYEIAPAHERTRMLEQLMMPLGVLSLVAVANGIFAKIRFRGGWPDLNVRLEDAQNVQAGNVVALVNHVQQVSVQAVYGLADLLVTSPVLGGSAAAALLTRILLRRIKTRQDSDDDLNP